MSLHIINIIGKGKFGTIYDMKKEIADGTFDPKNPSINIQGFGVWKLKTLEKSIARDLKECTSRGAEFCAKKWVHLHIKEQ